MYLVRDWADQLDLHLYYYESIFFIFLALCHLSMLILAIMILIKNHYHWKRDDIFMKITLYTIMTSSFLLLQLYTTTAITCLMQPGQPKMDNLINWTFQLHTSSYTILLPGHYTFVLYTYRVSKMLSLQVKDMNLKIELKEEQRKSLFLNDVFT